MLPTEPNQCSAHASWVPPTVVFPPCGGTSSFVSNYAPGDAFPVGTTTVTYTATNGAGSSSCSFTVTVQDLQAPVLNCPPPYWRVHCNHEVGFIYYPDYVENCPAPTFYGHGPYPFGVTTGVTAWLVDQSGNPSNVCTFDIEVVGDEPDPPRVQSTGSLDGVVIESKQGSGVGGSTLTAAAGILVGDDTSNRQSKAIFSFDLSSTPIPSTAIIERAYLRLTKTNSAGSPASLGALTADLANPAFGTTALTTGDFSASAGVYPNVATFGPIPASRPLSMTADIDPMYFSHLNRAGTNQFRVHFATPWINTGLSDAVEFASGDTIVAPSSRPELVIAYYLQSCNTCNPAGTGGPSSTTASFFPTPLEDGYLREANATAEVGLYADWTATTFFVGDTSTREQIMGMVSFDTSSIPANAYIDSASLTLTRTNGTGNPATLGPLVVDMRCGGIFGTTADLMPADFESVANFPAVATIPFPAAVGDRVTGTLSTAGANAIVKGPGAITQMKVRFSTPDNGNAIADYLIFASSEWGFASRPTLTVSYHY